MLLDIGRHLGADAPPALQEAVFGKPPTMRGGLQVEFGDIV
jgi:hypothetical protein